MVLKHLIKDTMIQPIVSVRVAAYNHEKYITQCIEGILMQKTDFPFEIIIGEDCSTDRTRPLVMAYQEKYPDIIRVLLSEHNVGGAQNILRIQHACRGKYLSMCEGDDYWIDPLKLQKQVDLLETRPEISMCFHNAFIINEPAAAVCLFFETPLRERLNFNEVAQIKTPTASVMARSEVLATLPAWRLNVWCGDLLSRLWCAHQGDLAYINEIMSVYRVHSGSLTAAQSSRQERARAEELFLYQQLNKDTGCQHAAVIQAQIERIEEKYRRNKLGAAYFLLKPHEIMTRLKQYSQAMKKYRILKYIGNKY